MKTSLEQKFHWMVGSAVFSVLTLLSSNQQAFARDRVEWEQIYEHYGHINWSIDGLGVQSAPATGTLVAMIPPGSFVDKAFLIATTQRVITSRVAQTFERPEITLDGSPIFVTEWENAGWTEDRKSVTWRADVTERVRDKLTPDGFVYAFSVVEEEQFDGNVHTPSARQLTQGSALVVVYSHGDEPLRSIKLFAGARRGLDPETYMISFDEPFNLGADSQALMSLGISGTQHSPSTRPNTHAFSVKANGKQLTNAAARWR